MKEAKTFSNYWSCGECGNVFDPADECRFCKSNRPHRAPDVGTPGFPWLGIVVLVLATICALMFATYCTKSAPQPVTRTR